jgi:hypothetical protein
VEGYLSSDNVDAQTEKLFSVKARHLSFSIFHLEFAKKEHVNGHEGPVKNHSSGSCMDSTYKLSRVCLGIYP